MKTLSLRSLLLVVPAALVAVSSTDAAMTSIWRTGTPASGAADALAQYTSLANLASNNPVSGSTVAITPNIPGARYTSIFGDFVQGQTSQGYLYVSVYNTTTGRVSQITRFQALASDPFANLRTNTGGVTFNLTTPGGNGWDREDDMYADGLGNFYRNRTANGGSNGVTKYTSFNDFVNDTNGVTYNLTATYGWNDRFFAFEGKFYRTNTGGPNGSVSGFATYNSFNDLLNGTVASTISSVNWAPGDIFIPVPAPGAIALAGLAGLAGRRNRRR